MPIALLTGPDDPAETRRAINELIIEINAGGGGGGGGSPALLVESGAESTISALAAGTAPDGTEEGVFVQGGVDVKLTTAQLLTSASAATLSGLNGTNIDIQAGDGDGAGSYGGRAYMTAGYGGYYGGYAGVFGGAGGSVGGYAYLNGGAGDVGGIVNISAGTSQVGNGNGAYIFGGSSNAMGSDGGNLTLGAGYGDNALGNIILSNYKTTAPSAIGALWVDPITKLVNVVTT